MVVSGGSLLRWRGCASAGLYGATTSVSTRPRREPGFARIGGWGRIGTCSTFLLEGTTLPLGSRSFV
eukprot:10297856-Alexandrium_andersonii.AAC.1